MASTVDFDRIQEFHDKDEIVDKTVSELADLINSSSYTVFYTGAGVSTGAGIPDYRGPEGCWTKRAMGQMAKAKVMTQDAQPTLTHMAMATLIHKNLAHYVVTTNLDGLHRKSGLGVSQVCNLHGDIYIERCTGCGYDFERNYHVRRPIDVHNHYVGRCSRCGSDSKSQQVGTNDKDVGTKDTHINFGEHLDNREWDDAYAHCGKADLVIVAGTSMSLRHITHLPFLCHKKEYRKKHNKTGKGNVVIINLQKTPDDEVCDLRIFANTETVFVKLMEKLNTEIEEIPNWKPRDPLPINKIPKDVHRAYVEAAQRLEDLNKFRDEQAKTQEKAKRKADAKKQNNKLNNKPAGKGKEPEEEAEEKQEKEDKMEEDEQQQQVRLVIGNLHEDITGINNNTHRWTMFVKQKGPTPIPSSSSSLLIKHVEFQLHPTFVPPSITVAEPPFSISRLGWGVFNITVIVEFTNGQLETFVHKLSFEKSKKQKKYVVNLQK